MNIYLVVLIPAVLAILISFQHKTRFSSFAQLFSVLSIAAYTGTYIVLSVIACTEFLCNLTLYIAGIITSIVLGIIALVASLLPDNIQDILNKRVI